MNKDQKKKLSIINKYDQLLDQRLAFFDDTSTIKIPDNPLERVIFQEDTKRAFKEVALKGGHVLLVGSPGTGKSYSSQMFADMVNKTRGDYIKPSKTVVGFPGSDVNTIRFEYMDPEDADDLRSNIVRRFNSALEQGDKFSLDKLVKEVDTVQKGLLGGMVATGAAGIFFPPLWAGTGLCGIGSIFMYMQKMNMKVTEKTTNRSGPTNAKDLYEIKNLIPEIIFDPRKEKSLLGMISEPTERNMKGGFRHDPYQSSAKLVTPIQKRAYLGALGKYPIICFDEIKGLFRSGFMPYLLEVMQNGHYFLEGGGRSSGSGAADRSETKIQADNTIIACANHDSYAYLKKEGEGAFLSRVMDKGRVIEMESSVPDTKENVQSVVQYIKQQITDFDKDLKRIWQKIEDKEGAKGVKRRLQEIVDEPLPDGFKFHVREFSREGVKELIKEMKIRAGSGKLTAILRPMNGVIRNAEMYAMFDHSDYVMGHHVQHAVQKTMSLEGYLTKDTRKYFRELPKYLNQLTNNIGIVIGLAVIQSSESGQMYGKPLPIRCQVNVGFNDTVNATGRLGEIAKESCQNVRANFKRSFDNTGAPQVPYEMYIQYIQTHGGVEGDSASLAMDIGLLSDFVQKPVNHQYGVTGSLAGDVVVSVGGVTQKVASIMDPELDMKGVCVPWLNRKDIEPLLINNESNIINYKGVPGIRIFRAPEKSNPFDVFFCNVREDAYKIMLGADLKEIDQKIYDRCTTDYERLRKEKNQGLPQEK